MNKVRIIPRIDIKGPNLVKGIHLEGLRVMGRPEEFARHYYENGADELMFVDVVASLYGRNSIHEIIEKVAKEIFIPLTVGGGIRTIDDIKNVLRSGADKVSINTAAIKSPKLIKKASEIFGSSTIVVTIETIKSTENKYLCYVDNGREHTGIEVKNWCREVENLGAGEIVLTSVDHEGIGEGFDIDLINEVNNAVSIPIIAHGGAGKLEHITDVFNKTELDAVAIASMLHYEYLKNIPVKDRYIPKVGNVDFLESGKGFSKITSSSVPEIKEHLSLSKIPCRKN